MLVETTILGRQHRLDQVVRHLVERHGLVPLDAPLADLVAVAVEESDRIFAHRSPVAARRLPCRQGQHHQQDQAPVPRVSASPATSATPRLMPVTRNRRMKSEKASARPEMNRPTRNRLEFDPGIDVDKPHGAPAAALVLERIAHWFLLLARWSMESARRVWRELSKEYACGRSSRKGRRGRVSGGSGRKPAPPPVSRHTGVGRPGRSGTNR